MQTKMHANLAQCANYFVQLFYQTGRKYTCTRSKIGKLLSIVNFLYARDDKLLFDEAVCKYEGCGTAIKELKFILDRDIYICSEYRDYKKEIPDAEFRKNASIPERYKETDRLSEDIKNTIRRVFQKFGAYSVVDLGDALSIIVEHSGVTKSDGKINPDIIKQLSIKNFSKEKTRENYDEKLMNFIFGT